MKFKTETVLDACTALYKLECTSAKRSEKIAVLRAHQKNALLRAILQWTYGGDVYHRFARLPRGAASWTRTPPPNGATFAKRAGGMFATLPGLLKDLRERHVTGAKAQGKVDSYVAGLHPWLARWFVRILAHDLRVGIRSSTIDEVWPDLLAGDAATSKAGETLPFLGCQLAAPYRTWPAFKRVVAEPKLDGFRLTALVGKKSVVFATRNGKTEPHTTNLAHVAKQLLALGFRDCLVDGEILVGGTWNGVAAIKRVMADDGKCSVKERMKNEQTRALLRDHARFVVFDYARVKSDGSLRDPAQPLRARRTELEGFFEKSVKTPNLALIEQRVLRDASKLDAAFEEALAMHHEGLMLKDASAPYEFKRTRTWLKCKPFVSVDVIVTGYYKGTGRNAHRLGGFVCKHKGKTINVGGGFKDHERDAFWKKRDYYVGKPMEITIQRPGATKVTKAGCHPNFRRWRVDKF